MFILLGAALGAAMIPGQATPTRREITPGTIAISTASTLPAETSRVFDDAVQQALLRLSFTPLPGQGHGRYIARVEVTRTSRGVVAADIPSSSPPLAALNGSVSLALPPGGDRLSDLVVTELTVVISRRTDAQIVWSGRAVTARVTGTRAGAIDQVARTLADAMLASFPRQAGSAISVP